MKVPIPSLSFGLKIQHHKTPLDQGIADAWDMLYSAKQEFASSGKQGIAIKLSTHSAQSIRANLSMKKHQTVIQQMNLLLHNFATHAKESRTQFPNGMARKIVQHLPVFNVLQQAVVVESIDLYFNNIIKESNKADLLDPIKEMIESLANEPDRQQSLIEMTVRLIHLMNRKTKYTYAKQSVQDQT